jgi:hypothetical protein
MADGLRFRWDFAALDKGWPWLNEEDKQLQEEWERAAVHLTWARKILQEAQDAYDEAKAKFAAVNARLDASLGIVRGADGKRVGRTAAARQDADGREEG